MTIDVSHLWRSLPATLRRSRMKTGFPHTAHTSPRRPKAVAEAAGRAADLAGEAGVLPPGVRLALAAVVAAVVAAGEQFNRLLKPWIIPEYLQGHSGGLKAGLG